MPKFCKKAVQISAFQWPMELTPNNASGDPHEIHERASRVREWMSAEGADFEMTKEPKDGLCILINTLEGQMKAIPGDWIIQGVQGEFYPCKPDIFTATYEPTENGQQMSDEQSLTTEGVAALYADPDESVEAAIQAKGLTAPRVTPEMLDAEIVSEQYHVFDGSCLTVCCLTLRNGFTVTGESACASPENFDAEIGQRIARDKARDAIWPLLEFRLRDQLAAGGITSA